MASTLDRMRKTIGSHADESMGSTRPKAPEKLRSATSAPPPAPPDPRWEGVVKDPEAAYIPLDRIIPDPDQPREDFDEADLAALAKSLESRGQLQPIVVRWSGEAGRWMIVDGERRWRASVAIGVDRIACSMSDPDADPGEVLVDQVVANCCRSELKGIEQARAYSRLMDLKGCTAASVAELVGVNKGTVSRALALLDLPGWVRDAVASEALSPTAAYELTKIPDPEQQAAVADRVIAGGLTGKQAAEEVRLATGRPPSPRGRKPGPIDWAGVPVDALAMPGPLKSDLIAAGIDTAGRAWALIETGDLVNAHGFSPDRSRLVEGAIVALREEAGDPAPCTLATEPANWRDRKIGDDPSIFSEARETCGRIGITTFGALDDRFAAGVTEATFDGWGGLLWSNLNRVKKQPPTVFKPSPAPPPAPAPALAPGEGRDVPRHFSGARPDPAPEVSPASPLPPWRAEAYGGRRELPIASHGGIEILARSAADADPWRVLAALRDAVARLEFATGPRR